MPCTECVQHVGNASCNGDWPAGSTAPSSLAVSYTHHSSLTGTCYTPPAHQSHQRGTGRIAHPVASAKEAPMARPLTHQYRDAKPLPPFNRHRLMHAVDLVRQSCTTMGCGDRGAGRGREGREQRQAEILPLAPRNTTRSLRLAMLRLVRGTHLAERMFRVFQPLMRVTRCCRSWGLLRGERTIATPPQGRRVDDIRDQKECSMRCPSQTTTSPCPVTQPSNPDLERRKPTSTAPSVKAIFPFKAFPSPASVQGAHNEWAIARTAAHPHRLRPRGDFEAVLQGSTQRGEPQPDAIPRMGTGARGEQPQGGFLGASGLGRTTLIAS